MSAVDDQVRAFAANTTRMLSERGWSQQFLADKAGVSLAVVSNLVRGLNGPTLRSALALAAAFCEPVDAMAAPPAVPGA